MELEDRLALIRQVGEEIVTEDELRALLEAKPHPIAYDGFEPSGTIHIAQGLLRAINVNRMTKAGVRFKMFVADWHGWANNKMGGDLEKIQTVGHYLIEIWRATGMDLDHVEFVWASDFVEDENYWKKVMNIARDSSLDRVLRTTQIMGRSDKDKLSAAQILYPCMQAADIFHLKADITQLGMDQRKVNMLAREVGPKLGFWKPVVVSHHMMMGLAQPATQAPIAPRLKEIAAPIGRVGTSGGPGGAQLLPAGFALRVGQAHDSFTTAADWDSALAIAKDLKTEIDAALKNLRSQPGMSGSVASQPEFDHLRSSAIAIIDETVKARESAAIERATAMKMSKSNPDSAIFMTDTPEQVAAKLKKAYCPPFDAAKKEAGARQENPVLEYFEYIVFARNHLKGAPHDVAVVINKPKAKGGEPASYQNYAELEAAYASGDVHPMDLKSACARYVNEMMEPVRAHFAKDEKARALKEKVDSFKVTR